MNIFSMADHFVKTFWWMLDTFSDVFLTPIDMSSKAWSTLVDVADQYYSAPSMTVFELVLVVVVVYGMTKWILSLLNPLSVVVGN